MASGMYGPIDPPEGRRGPVWVAMALVAFAGFLALAYAALHLPPEPSPLAGAVAGHLGEAGIGNPVNAVLVNFRAFDTVLETAVLILVLAGLWLLPSDRAWGGVPGNFLTRQSVEPPLVVLLKALLPLAALTAFYLLFHGAEEPGGAFQAGTILASVGILLVLARAMPPPVHSSAAIRWAVATGFLGFALAGIATLAIERNYMDFPPVLAKSIILAIELLLMPSLAATLFMLANGLPLEPQEDRP